MDAEFSEFQYVYGAIREIEGIMGRCGYSGILPAFPSQRQEKGLGYDVCFVERPIIAMFMQFKRAEHVSNRRTASEWNYYHSDYYRFKLYLNNRSEQHNILVRLAQNNPTNEVYYIAPCFYTYSDYRQYYLQEEIIYHSIIIDCKTLREFNDNNKHSISYRADGTDVLLKSKAVKIKDCKVILQEKKFDIYRNGKVFVANMNDVLDKNFESISDVHKYLLANGIILQLWQT